MRTASLAAAAAIATVTLAGAATAQRRPPLTMTCHPLIRSAPSVDETVYTVIGDTMFSRSLGQTRRISTEGRPMFLSRTLDRGVPTLSYASHARAGRIVTRRVYWQTGRAPRRLAFSERFDFAAQRITSRDEPGDTCHHDGR